jgi:hypothetical protein
VRVGLATATYLERLATAAATSLVVGSAIWGAALRGSFRLDDETGVESALADIARWLIGAPHADQGSARVS